MDNLTFTMENYLEAIYELSRDGDGARVSDIAERLGVTKPSTNSAMSTLSKKGLVVTEKYKKIFLTPAGLELAKFTSKKHQVIQKFFTEVLKINATIADKDACAIEHVISSDSIHAMQQFLSNFKDEK